MTLLMVFGQAVYLYVRDLKRDQEGLKDFVLDSSLLLTSLYPMYYLHMQCCVAVSLCHALLFRPTKTTRKRGNMMNTDFITFRYAWIHRIHILTDP